jgi:hypothetical protein
MTEQQHTNSNITTIPCPSSFAKCGLSNMSQHRLDSLDLHYPNKLQVDLIPQILSQKDCDISGEKATGKTTALILGVASQLSRKKTSLILVIGKDKSYINYFKVSLLAFVKNPNFQMTTDSKQLEKLITTNPTVLFQTYEQLTTEIPYVFDAIICDNADHFLFEEKISNLKVKKYKQLITCAQKEIIRFAPQIIVETRTEPEVASETELTEKTPESPLEKVEEKAEQPARQPPEEQKAPESGLPKKITTTDSALICETKNKYKILLGLLEQENPDKATVFVNTKVVAVWLKHKLQNNGYKVTTTSEPEPKSRPRPPQRGRERSFVREREPLLNHGLVISQKKSQKNNSLNLNIHFDVFDKIEFREALTSQEKRVGLSTSNYYLICEDYCHFFEKTSEIIPAATWHNNDLLNSKDKQPEAPKKEVKYKKQKSALPKAQNKPHKNKETSRKKEPISLAKRIVKSLKNIFSK